MLRSWLAALAGSNGKEDEMAEGQALRDVAGVLVRIDALHFQALAEEAMKEEDRFAETYAMMSRFLTLREFKRLNPQYEKQILKERQVEDLIALLLYLAVNSELKREAVESILDFGEH